MSLVKRSVSGGGGGVSSVAATAPITSSGGTTPTISTSMNTGKILGRTTAGIGVAEEITPGAGMSFVGGVLKISGTDPIAYSYWGA